MFIDVRIKGIRPLLQNDSFEVEEDVVKKGQAYDDIKEAEKRLIQNKNGVICQKATHIEGAMVKSAAEFKFQGQKTYKDLFKAGVFVQPRMIPHLVQEWEIDKQQVKIQRARIMRVRPRFDDWELEFQIECTDERLQFEVVKRILENAGKTHGIGDYRPRYGLFEVVKFDQVEEGNISD